MRLDLLVNDFVYRAITDGFLLVSEKDFKRNYVHIDDVARCVCFCLEHFGELRGEGFNVGLTEAHLSKWPPLSGAGAVRRVRANVGEGASHPLKM
jgi:nucleoside-diphosphate-sugar epimerase